MKKALALSHQTWHPSYETLDKSLWLSNFLNYKMGTLIPSHYCCE